MAGHVRGAWRHSVEITEDVPLSVQQLPVGGSCSPLKSDAGIDTPNLFLRNMQLHSRLLGSCLYENASALDFEVA